VVGRGLCLSSEQLSLFLKEAEFQELFIDGRKRTWDLGNMIAVP
jgi:hypothetical protein